MTELKAALVAEIEYVRSGVSVKHAWAVARQKFEGLLIEDVAKTLSALSREREVRFVNTCRCSNCLSDLLKPSTFYYPKDL